MNLDVQKVTERLRQKTNVMNQAYEQLILDSKIHEVDGRLRLTLNMLTAKLGRLYL